ncbi:MAG: hypothetical protein J1E37_08440 [Prevotella sp.]|nr:hypothetical protein [Prevotella sp.]
MKNLKNALQKELITREKVAGDSGLELVIYDDMLALKSKTSYLECLHRIISIAASVGNYGYYVGSVRNLPYIAFYKND